MPSTSVEIVVPSAPARISLSCASAPIAARLPVARAKRQAASTFGPIDPAANFIAASASGDARRVRVTAADLAVVESSLAAWVAELVSIGYSAEFAAAVRGRPERPVAITFTPTAGFQQTPGPDAGTRLPQ